MKEQKGAVWYYREGGDQDPPSVAMEVMKAVVDARLPFGSPVARFIRTPSAQTCCRRPGMSILGKPGLLRYSGIDMTGKCIRCGAETDFQVGDTWICESCYQARSSCCPEFGPDDLTDGVREQGTARRDAEGSPE